MLQAPCSLLVAAAVVRLDQGDDTKNLLTGRAQGHESRAAEQSLLSRDISHAGRDLAAFKHRGRRTQSSSHAGGGGRFLAAVIGALLPEQIVRSGAQPGAAGLIQVDQRERIVQHIQRRRGKPQQLG